MTNLRVLPQRSGGGHVWGAMAESTGMRCETFIISARDCSHKYTPQACGARCKMQNILFECLSPTSPPGRLGPRLSTAGRRPGSCELKNKNPSPGPAHRPGAAGRFRVAACTATVAMQFKPHFKRNLSLAVRIVLYLRGRCRGGRPSK